VVPAALNRGTAVRRSVWVGASLLAAAALVTLAAHGHRPDTSLVRFEPAGVMSHTPPELITEVTLWRDEQRWRFTRGPGGSWVAAPGAPAGPDVSPKIERGLRFLHVSAPQRVLTRDELSDTSLTELGLHPPRYLLSIGSSAAPTLTIEFGGLNAQRLGQYARIRDHQEILLLPSFVGEPWGTIGPTGGSSH
jgi:hypothetical protein